MGLGLGPGLAKVVSLRQALEIDFFQHGFGIGPLLFHFGPYVFVLGLGWLPGLAKVVSLRQGLAIRFPVHGFCIGPLLFDVGPSVAVLDLGLGSELGQSGVRHVVMIDR